MWSLDELFLSEKDPKIQEERDYIIKWTDSFATKWRENNKFLNSPENLKQALDEWEEFSREHGGAGKQSYYGGLRGALDQLDPEISKLNSEIQKVAIENGNKLQFFMLELGKVSAEKQREFLNYAGLAPYKHLLERIFATAKYDLSEKEETVMNYLYPSAKGNWIDLTEKLISKSTAKITIDGKKQEKTVDELMELTRNIDETVRKQAAQKVNKILKNIDDVAEAEINSLLEYQSAQRKLRGVKRPDELRLESDDIEPEVVDAMRTAVSRRNEIVHRYYKLKAQMLGKTKIEYYERGIDFPTGENAQFSYEESVKIVHEVFSELDPEFGEIFEEFVTSGKVDVYPKKGKSGGAFCAHDSLNSPVYILLNHTNVRGDVSTLAHESGHGVNNMLMKKTQNAFSFGTTLAVAEVASTFMEDFVAERMMKDVDKRYQLAIIMNKLNDQIASIFRQVACYQFEYDLHTEFEKRRFLGKKDIAQIFKKRMEEYMGPYVKQSLLSDTFWIIWSHIRRGFYVYSYASGLLISKALQREVRANPAFITKVKQILSAGTSKSPSEIFADAGINIKDPAFWEKGLDEIQVLLEQAENLSK